MKHRKLFTGLGITAIVIAMSAGIVCTSAGASNSDPLVTLSYLNNTVIPKITEDVKNAVLEIIRTEDKTSEENGGETQPPAETPTQTPTETPETTTTETPAEETPTQEIDVSALKYTVVCLSQGQKLMAKGAETESTEIILRSGTATAISPFAEQGVADLTASVELYNGDSLVKNNYCIIPRGSDGRGICATSDVAYILVRGEYEIVQE